MAIGDSQTEGMCDGDDVTGYRGWAGRLAERLSQDNPDFRYAYRARIESRLLAVNQMMREFADSYDFVLVDLVRAPASRPEVLVTRPVARVCLRS